MDLSQQQQLYYSIYSPSSRKGGRKGKKKIKVVFAIAKVILSPRGGREKVSRFLYLSLLGGEEGENGGKEGGVRVWLTIRILLVIFSSPKRRGEKREEREANAHGAGPHRSAPMGHFFFITRREGRRGKEEGGTGEWYLNSACVYRRYASPLPFTG